MGKLCRAGVGALRAGLPARSRGDGPGVRVTTVAVLGLGRMGVAMAGTLRAAGHSVTGWSDLDP
ncbi:NAD(P)-binding domain-containing protein [Luteipulveratus mongoliensis]|uniref:NAD(P)-binding domain-containing protein n=1 Tax=Luteipulveratus mongoliensis TaxID=571913 RepID=UPI00316AEC2A